MTNDSVEAVIEDLRLWDPMFYSDSETKLIMNLAADYLDQYVVRMVACNSCGLMHPKTDCKCPKCGAAKERQEVLDKIQEIENKIPTQIVTAEYYPTDEEKADKSKQ